MQLFWLISVCVYCALGFWACAEVQYYSEEGTGHQSCSLHGEQQAGRGSREKGARHMWSIRSVSEFI